MTFSFTGKKQHPRWWWNRSCGTITSAPACSVCSPGPPAAAGTRRSDGCSGSGGSTPKPEQNILHKELSWFILIARINWFTRLGCLHVVFHDEVGGDCDGGAGPAHDAVHHHQPAAPHRPVCHNTLTAVVRRAAEGFQDLSGPKSLCNFHFTYECGGGVEVARDVGVWQVVHMEAVVLQAIAGVLGWVHLHVVLGRVQHVRHPDPLQVVDVADRIPITFKVKHFKLL